MSILFPQILQYYLTAPPEGDDPNSSPAPPSARAGNLSARQPQAPNDGFPHRHHINVDAVGTRGLSRSL